MSATQAPERLEFKTELKQLLDLIIHSLYTKKEIFLRELISNAADAIDKARFEGLKHPELLEGDTNWRIKLTVYKDAGTLMVSDNGIGMSREAVVQDLGTIARSGTKAFIENLKQADVKDRPDLIGQFGVGFYSSFMAAERVTVVTRAAGSTEAVKWESDGQGEFTIETADRPSRGTDVILHLREDAKEFLDPYRLRQIVKQYSDFIEHPIVMDVESVIGDDKTEVKEETFNSRQAIWLRNKNEVKPEEYTEFYKSIGRDFEDPLKVIHVSAEGGATDFKALMFIPAHRPMDFFYKEPKSGLDLYVKRVLIQHESEELLPTYLRFVKGVVDAADLPLNVSRETLQHHPLLAKIKSNLINRVLKTLGEMKDGEYENYLKFYKEFGVTLKEGVPQDWSNKERIADLLLFESTKTKPGEYTTLAKYVEAMPAEQKEIHYIIGETRQQIENSPYLESFKAKGEEVLLLTEPIDEFVMSTIGEYKGKKIQAADRGEVEKKEDARFEGLLKVLAAKLPRVKEVRLSGRLKESAAVLVTDEHGPSAHFERIMKRAGRSGELPESKRILELNPDHPAVTSLLTLFEKSPTDDRIDAFGHLLYEEAVIAEGSKIDDIAGFAKRLNDLIVKASA
ncbi:MAG: molecular chaperone HtpG [Phycisphaerales bacterium]|nr:molecular chaperone HtpG [Phycisphaerales bacterium]